MNSIKITLDYLKNIDSPKYNIILINPDTKQEAILYTEINKYYSTTNNEKEIVNKLIKVLNDKMGIYFNCIDIFKTDSYKEYVKTLPYRYVSIEDYSEKKERIRKEYEVFLETLSDDKRKLINAYNDHFRL